MVRRLVQGLTAAATAEALPPTLSGVGQGGPAALRATAQQEELKGAQPPATAGIVMANGIASVCFRTVWHQPEPQQLPAGFTGWGLPASAPRSGCSRLMSPSWRSTPSCGRRPNGHGARIFFADGQLPGDAELLAEGYALVDSSSPRYEKASYYSAVCLETMECWNWGQQQQRDLGSLTQLKEKHPGPLRVIWDNRGEAVREYLRTPGLELRLVNLPARTSTPVCFERGGHWQSVPGEQGGGSANSWPGCPAGKTR